MAETDIAAMGFQPSKGTPRESDCIEAHLRDVRLRTTVVEARIGRTTARIGQQNMLIAALGGSKDFDERIGRIERRADLTAA
jgi:hypothetical protein